MDSDIDLEKIGMTFLKRYGDTLKKIISISWFPIALLIFFSSYLMFIYDDSGFSIDDIDYDFPGGNGEIAISIEDKLMKLCDSVDENLVYYAWHLMILFFIGDLMLWSRQFFILSDKKSKIYKDIYDGLCSARTTCCLILIIYIIFIFGKS